jgi:hypothetical protein
MTLKPSFNTEGGLVQLKPAVAPAFKQGWTQNAAGETVPGDILASLAKPGLTRNADGEF